MLEDKAKEGMKKISREEVLRLLDEDLKKAFSDEEYMRKCREEYVKEAKKIDDWLFESWKHSHTTWVRASYYS